MAHVGRNLNRAILIPTFTVGVEVANVIPVTIDIKDMDGNLANGTAEVLAELVDGDCLPVLSAAYTMAVGAKGVLITTTAKAQVMVTSDAAGGIVLDVTQVAGGIVATIYLMLTVLGYPGEPVRVPLTYDGV